MPSPALANINALVDRGEYARALPLLERALARAPGESDLIALMSFVLFRMGRFVRAEYFARQLLARMPESPHAQHNLGNTLAHLGRHREALPILERALELGGREPNIRIALAGTYAALNRPMAAAGVLRAGLEENPGHAAMRGNYAHALHAMGRVEEAVDLMRQLAAEAPDDVLAADALCAALNYAPGASAQEVFEAHARYGRLVEAGVAEHRFERPWVRAGDRLNIGLLSSDLREHAVGYLIEDLVEHADRGRVTVSCYGIPPVEDAVMRRLRSKADRWRSLEGLSYADAAAVVRRDRVHVLVDLAGHTKGHLLKLMAQRAAPVQMTYTGYPNTTGLTRVDYRIVDSITDPAGVERYHTEKLIRLDPCYMSYRPPDVLPEVSVRDGSHAVTFASFSSLLKFNRPLLALWARVLNAVPGSRLMLMHHALAEGELRGDVAARFAALGVEPSRVVTREPAASREGVFAAYADVDIALDTYPYNGAVTVVEALLMGAPYVSMAGESSASRAALSVLSAVGLAELCARGEEGYVGVAAALAGDDERRARLRGELRGRVLGSCICDGPGFAGRFVEACFGAVAEREAAV